MPNQNVYQDRLVNQDNTLTINAGATVSSNLDVRKAKPIALITPGTFTAGNLTFQASPSGAPGTFNTILDPTGNGADLTIAGKSSSHIPLDPAVFAGVNFLQITCSVAQASIATIQVISGPIWEL